MSGHESNRGKQGLRRSVEDFIRSNLLGLIAIVIALSGTAYATGTAPVGPAASGRSGGEVQVASRQESYASSAKKLSNNSVGTQQLKNNAVNGSKVKNGSLTGSDLNVSTLPAVPNATHAQSADSATNADTVGGKHASDFLPVGATAANADTLDGKHAYELLGANATAANSERLNNMLASAFLQIGTNAGGDLTGTFPSPSIANGAIDDNNVVPNSLTGTTIDESTLGQVPSAANSTTFAGKNLSEFIQTGTTAGGDLSGYYPYPSLAEDSVNSAKVAENSLTGSDILESSLGQVPSAASASNSNQLGGYPPDDFGALMSARIRSVPALEPFGERTLWGAADGVSTATTPYSLVETGMPNKNMIIRDLAVFSVSGAPGNGNVIQVRVGLYGSGFGCQIANSASSCTAEGGGAGAPGGPGNSLVTQVTEISLGNPIPATEIMVGYRLTSH